MSKALLNAAQVAGLIGQRRRAYSPDRTEWMDYVVLRPAYGGRVWVRYDHKPTYLARALNLNRATLRKRLRSLGLADREGDDDAAS